MVNFFCLLTMGQNIPPLNNRPQGRWEFIEIQNGHNKQTNEDHFFLSQAKTWNEEVNTKKTNCNFFDFEPVIDKDTRESAAQHFATLHL